MGHPVILRLTRKIMTLRLMCAKLRIVEIKIEDNKILGLNGNLAEKHEG